MLLALCGRSLSAARPTGVRRTGRVLYVLGMSWWAGSEMLHGANAFRRALGLGALLSLLPRG